MAEMKTSTVESLLGVLSLGPKSGYEMRQFMEQSTGNFWSESFGQIYPALKRMLADGLVMVEDSEGDGRRAKKVYRITKAGLARLKDWLGIPAVPRPNRHELLLKVFFGARAELGAIAAQTAGWRKRYAADLERYEHILPKLEAECAGHPGLPFWQMTVRYGIAEARMVMAWCDETLMELQRIEDRG
jgi:PadR family transcriptional regulator AphA